MQVIFSPSGVVVELPGAVVARAEAAATEMMDAQQLRYLAAALVAYPWRPGDLAVEIGAYIGRTAVFMAQVLHSIGQRIPVLSIDPFERATADEINPRGSYSGYVQTIRSSDVADLCLPLAAFSQDAAPVVPAQVGVLLIDGDHHAAGITADLRLYAPKVRPHGFIFIDDYAPRFPGILQAVEDYFVADGPFEVLHTSSFVLARRKGDPSDASTTP
jgi:cephalosporin hydroxylase